MSTSSPVKAEEMDVLLKRAVEFHGHLGPFLVLGLRMGLIGLRELNAKRREKKLRVTAKLKYSIPFSCVVDGLQIATKCTMGNKKLRIRNYSGIEAKFEIEGGKQVTVAVNSALFDTLKRELPSGNVPSEEIRELARIVASTPEEELFTISRG
ncbi:MAG: formylmethanofuran dehydrogenase subunit E family protein [Candidatus Bathyarchaeum sp.]|nr:MAG: formylmethanofuran dehydrogenase subunit E family protein [Candidatus Bathyarchaeum sp.]